MSFETLAEWLAWQETLHPRAVDLGLSRMGEMVKRLELERTTPFTFTVGGTNGKGSCVAMLSAILRAAGYRVGTYTSPHIVRYNERIAIDGEPVSDAAIVASFERIEQVREGLTLSFFEFGTLAALDLFSREGVDIRVLEVGLGGRLDAVNIVDADVALISSIDIDHEDWLGYDRESIGYEKAGIFRSGCPAIVGDPEAPASVIGLAQTVRANLYRLGHEFGYQRRGDGWRWTSGRRVIGDLPLPAIPGEHQLMNAAAVIQALARLPETLPVKEEAIREGLTTVNLPGRFQLFPGTVPVLLDVAHNPQAVKILVQHLERDYANRPIHAIFAVMRDKDIDGILRLIRDRVHAWYLPPLKMVRAAAPEALSERFQALGMKPPRIGYRDLGEALAAARARAEAGDLILVFGSFFLVSDYLAHSLPEEV